MNNQIIARNMEGIYGGSFPSGSPFHTQAMDLNEYNSQLCRSGCSLQHLETMGNISGLAVQDLYSGSILKPNITENKNMLDLIHTTRPNSKTKTQPSTLEVVEYESTKHDHLPDYARAMIEMIEEAEYEMLHDYITSKDEWHRDVRIEEDGTETITWIHKSELVDDALRDYEKFLVDGSILLEEEKGVELPWEGEIVTLGKMFNLSVGDCK
ncbi:hypothetical protein [Escherichia phage vB-EcoP-XT73]|uniref:ABC transporter n=1 Tax=Escherichia phage vB-EcoP-XT18 TaxID=3093889 RepID=A0ABZ0S3C7_9CAUD|nr:ABC transporter [Escherichia phage vB-EcoP-XT18]WPK41937.1 hypothetical protein [Escherichia phage vB-EcoP-XT32]WPK42109.1 hypothetical protein [Escherichia phage vB-EcoP-XT73]